VLRSRSTPFSLEVACERLCRLDIAIGQLEPLTADLLMLKFEMKSLLKLLVTRHNYECAERSRACCLQSTDA
jgi:hypothetical protein